jgi:hypothetical protein
MVEFTHPDLREPGIARMAGQGIGIVFHLAAGYGGRHRFPSRMDGGGRLIGISPLNAGMRCGRP